MMIIARGAGDEGGCGDGEEAPGRRREQLDLAQVMEPSEYITIPRGKVCILKLL